MSRQPRKPNGQFAPTAGSKVALKDGPGGVLTIGTRAGNKAYMTDQAGKTVVRKISELRPATPGDYAAFRPAAPAPKPKYLAPKPLKTGIPGRSSGRVTWK